MVDRISLQIVDPESHERVWVEIESNGAHYLRDEGSASDPEITLSHAFLESAGNRPLSALYQSGDIWSAARLTRGDIEPVLEFLYTNFGTLHQSARLASIHR